MKAPAKTEPKGGQFIAHVKTLPVGRDIFVPHDQQSDVLALQLSMDRRPIRLGMAAVSPFASAIGVKRRLQFGVADPLRQRPTKPSAARPASSTRLVDGRANVKAKAETSWKFCELGTDRASAGRGGVGDGCTKL